MNELLRFLKVPMEEIPEEFVPLKNFFRSLLEMYSKKKFFLLILIGERDATEGICAIFYYCLCTLLQIPLRYSS